jgi:chemotaxis protein methyltransferase CheR
MNSTLIERLEQVLAALEVRTGLNLAGVIVGAPNDILVKLLSRLRTTGVDRLLDAINSQSSLFDDLVEEITVRESYFFREPRQFDFIRGAILPEVVALRGPNHMLRCWSAACASGEEAYSLAVVLREAGLGNRSSIVASDISLTALARARAGKYRQYSLRGAGVAAITPYLTNEGELSSVCESIRRQVNFARINLAQQNYSCDTGAIGQMDIILCRNALIFFDEAAVAAVARRLFDSLADGGWLLTAATDPPLAEYAPFEVVAGRAGLAYRRPVRHSMMEASSAKVGIQLPTSYDHGDRNDGPESSIAVQSAFDGSDYAHAPVLTREFYELPAACVLHLRALINMESSKAAEFAERAIELHPLTGELYYLLGSIFIASGDFVEAAAVLRKALYLEPNLAIARFALASVLTRLGDPARAQRSSRNAVEAFGLRLGDEIVPMSSADAAAVV